MNLWMLLIEWGLRIFLSAYLFKLAASMAFDKGRFDCSIRTEDEADLNRFQSYIEKYCWKFGIAVGIVIVIFSAYSLRGDMKKEEYLFRAGMEAGRQGVTDYKTAYNDAREYYSDMSEQVMDDDYGQSEWP